MRCPAALLLLPLLAPPAASQQVRAAGVRAEMFTGSELENYLRALQVAGGVASHPWSLRGFSALELDRILTVDTLHPWAHRYDLSTRAPRSAAVLLRPAVTGLANTTFPYGSNDGAVWAGKGLTTVVQAGVAARRGALSVTVAPLAFWSQNAAFRLMPNGASGRQSYADGLHGDAIDLPQRFGSSAYAALDPGQSTLRLDAGGVALGVTTANENWGPAREFPILFGNNAAGFPHVFLGTSTPVELSIVRLHGRLMWGRLSQSAYSPETAAAGRRFGAGLVLVLTSRHLPGLEIGAGRFSHAPWRPGGPTLGDLLVPLGSQLGANVAAEIDDNQLAAAFVRWVLPRSGFELYGEYGRDDYNLDLRDFAQEPDHIGGYTIGFGKVLRSATRLRVVRAEIQNLQYSVLAQGRMWQPFYTHATTVRQGHTQRGQLLGSYAGFGGAGALVALESYHARGRWTLSWCRVLRYQRGAFATDSVIDPRGLDVQHALSWNVLLFRGRYDIGAGATAVYEFNRDFRADAVNVNATLGVRAAWP